MQLSQKQKIIAEVYLNGRTPKKVLRYMSKTSSIGGLFDKKQVNGPKYCSKLNDLTH